MKRRCVFSFLTVLAIILSLVAPLTTGTVLAGAPHADGLPTPNPQKDISQLERVAVASPEVALQKIDPYLRELAQKGGKEVVQVSIAAKPGTDLSKYLDWMIVRPVILGTQRIYGRTTASQLLDIAARPDVAAIVAMGQEMRDKPYDAEDKNAPSLEEKRARLQALRENEVPYQEAAARMQHDVSAQGWFDVLDGHESSAAWDKGFDGNGVVVALLDDGVDFAHPDLQGTAARVTDPSSPYYGWPMAFSQVSTLYFAQEVLFQDLGARGITEGWPGSRWVAIQDTFEVHPSFEGRTATVVFQPQGSGVPHEYTIPVTSQSNLVKMGSLPERNLESLYGERVAVLVADEHIPGVYDTVYVDLDNDYDFTDEKPVTKASPEVYRDMDGDGYADISGGMLVWISDGANPPPTVNWLWGIVCGDEVGTLKACPMSGDLLLFAGPFDGGYTHGTQCASNIAGQGVVSEGLTAQPFRQGGMVQGGAPKVGIMDFGNHYYLGTDEDEFLVAALGYDGMVESGDEAQIVSNSYGAFEQMWGGWGYMGRLITALNLTLAPRTVWLFSAGNEGPGYGPQEGDGSPTTIQVGSSTQYGSTNWDSIVSADQIVYGDPSTFFSKGPNRDGSSGLDVLANGGRGAGDEGLNYFGFDGATSWGTWGGTSRSAPVAAANLALVFQAYKARYGEWPTWDVAKALLKSGATNSVSSPFYQGAGVVNADRSTDLAAGIYGVYVTPDEWQAGDWEGTEYLNFAKVVYPGDVVEKTFEVHNPSGYNITVDLSDGVMQLITKTELSFTTADESEESAFNFHTPDYLMPLDPDLIPADAELMVVRYVHSYDTFDPVYDFSATPNSSWRFMLYNWTDVNGDGKLWEDLNGNGVVNHESDWSQIDNDGFARPDFANSEIQEGEYIRMDYEFGGLAVPIMVHDPLERMADGYFFGWQHRYNDGTVPQTTFKIGVEFYKRADWSWLQLSADQLTIPAESTRTFDAQLAVPADAAPGAYEGVIFINDPGTRYHEAHEIAVPVVVNVIADLPDGGLVTLGGEDEMASMLYQNSYTYGYFNWYGGGWTGAGDWRHYFLNIDDADVAAQNLLIHATWDADYPTDMNIWVLGPTEDCASSGVDPCAWYEPGLGQPDPGVFGPYTLQPIASSDPFETGATYRFHTSTGGPEEWLSVPLEDPGLYALALHNVLYDGEELATRFQVDVGTLTISPSMDPEVGEVTVGSIDAVAYTQTGSIDLDVTTTIDTPDLVATLTGGLVPTMYGPFDVVVPDTGGCYSAWCEDNVYEPFEVTQVGAVELKVHLNVGPTQDADLFLIYDANDNGIPEEGIDPVVGSSGNPAGSDEEITLANPALGGYFAAIDGYDVEPDEGAELSYWYQVTAPGDLPKEPVDLFDGGVPVDQDAPVDPTTSSFVLPITLTERVAGLYAELTDIPEGADVDLYLVDGADQIIAMSQERGNADDAIELMPADGEYRLEPGANYEIWVHGFDVPEPVTPTLHVWYDQLNLWLDSGDPSVHVSDISAGETVSLSLVFDKEGWEPDDAPLSARLVVGPESLPNALEHVVTIERGEPPEEDGEDGEEGWSPWYLYIDLMADSVRGPSIDSYWALGGYPIDTALVGPGERITYTVYIENYDIYPTPKLLVDVWPLPQDYLDTWYAVGGDQIDGVNYGLLPNGFGAVDYGGGISWEGVLDPGDWVTFSYWVEMPADMEGYDNHTSGVDVYDADTFEWYGWDLAGGWLRPFSMGDSVKISDPGVVLPGETFAYRLLFDTRGSLDKDVYVSDPLPPEVEFVSATNGAVYDPGTHTVTWTGTMPGNSSDVVEIDIEVRARDDLAYDSVFVNTATLSDKYSGEPLGTVTALTRVGSEAALGITKTVDRLRAHVGDWLVYKVTFENTGAQEARDVLLTDQIPPYLDVNPDSVTATKASGVDLYDPLAGEIRWAGTLEPGESVTLSFAAQVNGSATTDLAVINGAWIAAENYPTALYNSAVTEITDIWESFLPMSFRW